MPEPDESTDSTVRPESSPTADGFTVTPYAVEGEIDYEKLLERFGADRLTDEQIARFPDYPLLRRRTFYAGRNVDDYLEAADAPISAMSRRNSSPIGSPPTSGNGRSSERACRRRSRRRSETYRNSPLTLLCD